VDEFEAQRGVRRRVRWVRRETCAACDGDGAAPGAMSMPCPGCAGTGRRRVDSSLADGERLIQIQDCPTCGGRGHLVSKPCPACNGQGVTVFDESDEVQIPAGASDGDRIPLQNGRAREVVVRVLAAPADSLLVRYVAVLGPLVALICLWLLLR